MDKIWVSSSPGSKGILGTPLKEDRIFYLNTDILNEWIEMDVCIWIKLMSNVGRNELRIKGDAIRTTGCFFFKEGVLRAIDGESSQNIVLVYRIPLPSRNMSKFHLNVENNKLWIKFYEKKIQVKHEEIFELTNYIAKIYPKDELKKLVNESFSKIRREFQ